MSFYTECHIPAVDVQGNVVGKKFWYSIFYCKTLHL